MSQKNQSNDRLSDFIIKLFHFFTRICYFGARNINFKSFEAWCSLLIIASLLGATLLGDTNHLQNYVSAVFPPLQTFFNTSPFIQYTALLGLFGIITLFIFGFRDFRKHIAFQKAVDCTGLKNAKGQVPKIISIISKGEYRSRVLIEAFGVGLNKFEAQKDSLIAGFRQAIESIVLHKDKGRVEIHLCQHDLPKVIDFQELYTHIKEPYSFIVGQSLRGPIVQTIRDLPHLLVSGATGGGKSVFFRSTMLSLLKSSSHIQLYLLDLKRGVEVKEFTQLPNVKTAKNESDAVSILGALVKEMNRRYKILEDKGQKLIDPQRDKLDIIIIGIDEAASLFGKPSNPLARKHIGELARLARAAGIHLIPSTQKPVKEAIHTETLDNIPARMTFRMISTAASNVAMGGNFAKKLPAIKGRAVWTNGSEQKEVQAPYIDDEVIEAELQTIHQEFNEGTRKNFQPLLETNINTKMLEVDKNDPL